KTERKISEKRMIIKKEAEDKKIKKMSFENLFSQIEQKEKLTLNLILKCDVRGSVEAIHSSLNELGGEKINVNIIHEDVGGILESDIMLAAASNAIVIGFKVRPEAAALSLAKAKNIEIRLYDIIYKLIDDMKAAMSGMLGTVVEDTVVGTALVKEVFKISGIGKIAGCVVNQGKIVFPSYAKLIRDNIVLYDSKLNSLKHYKNDVKEVNFGQECGIGLDKYEDIKVGDIIECYVKVEKKQEL
ncbi:MAG TPA: translation initiation factor IF-2, partial [bacterium]|nr:translation initiation factor IF-2 [bacterium]